MHYLKLALDLTAFVDDNDNQICPDPVEFWAKPFMEKDHRELMQKHFGLSDKEREAAQHSHNVAMLAKLAGKPPKGVPGFPKKYTDIETAIIETLGEATDINTMLAEMLVSEHFQKSGNRYFFR